MYIVRRKSDNTTMMICTRPEDAMAWVKSRVDGHEYVAEEQGSYEKSLAMPKKVEKSS